MFFIFLISLFPFFFLFFNPLPSSWPHGMPSDSTTKSVVTTSILSFAFRMSAARNKVVPKTEKIPAAAEEEESSILDLPDLALESILTRLPPSELRNIAGVCRSIREICRSDRLWEIHMRQKWGRIIGQRAHEEWQLYATLRNYDFYGGRNNSTTTLGGGMITRFLSSISYFWPLSWIKSKFPGTNPTTKTCFPTGSIMSWYLSLECGKFWFPAQIYNRENGHVGFMLSCYDAEIGYDRDTDTFRARYPPHGRRTIVVEDGVQWERIRAPPVETTAYNLHTSDCFTDLSPGDDIEIQWRKSKDFPYGWWYGVVGHLENCDGTKLHCQCRQNDIVVLEFNQYEMGSRWRRTTVDRKEHQEEGNEIDGFYGGIRRLQRKEEISMWKKLWPNQILE